MLKYPVEEKQSVGQENLGRRGNLVGSWESIVDNIDSRVIRVAIEIRVHRRAV